MKVLIVGGGGREHAIAISMKKSKRVEKLYCVPGNAGIAQIAVCEPSIGVMEFDKVVAYAKEKQVSEIVLGYPKNMNGTVGVRGEKSEALSEILKERTSLPVILWDERSTTVSAHQILNEHNVRGKKRKNTVDAVAATLILQTYLDYKAMKK